MQNTGPSPSGGVALRPPLEEVDRQIRKVMKEGIDQMKSEIREMITLNVDSTAPIQPRAFALPGAEGPPKWAKELDKQNLDDEETDPFARGSADPAPGAEEDDQGGPRAANSDQLVGDGSAPPGPEPAGPAGPRVEDLVSGAVPDAPWQFNPYDRNVSTWLAAAQRRHQHRRRSNALLGVASVDLSEPHEPTPNDWAATWSPTGSLLRRSHH